MMNLPRGQVKTNNLRVASNTAARFEQMPLSVPLLPSAFYLSRFSGLVTTPPRPHPPQPHPLNVLSHFGQCRNERFAAGGGPDG